MLLRDALDIVEHWRDEPSIGACVRAHLGVKPAPSLTVAAEEPEAPKEITQAQFDEMLREMQGLAAQFNSGARPGQ